MQPLNISQSDIVYRSIQVSKRGMLAPIQRYSPEKMEKSGEEGVKLASSASCQSYRPYLISHKKKPSLNRSTSLHSHLIQESAMIPTRAREFNEMVNKKRSLLRIKHKIKGASDCIPNILEIRESIKKEEVSFVRRMDSKLNSNGNANLLINLKRDFRMKSQNYMREINEKNRKQLKYHRKEYLNERGNVSRQQYITLQYKPLLHSDITIE